MFVWFTHIETVTVKRNSSKHVKSLMLSSESKVSFHIKRISRKFLVKNWPFFWVRLQKKEHTLPCLRQVRRYHKTSYFLGIWCVLVCGIQFYIFSSAVKVALFFFSVSQRVMLIRCVLMISLCWRKSFERLKLLIYISSCCPRSWQMLFLRGLLAVWGLFFLVENTRVFFRLCFI